ncbi:hypothetical protein FOZ60_007792 [Perkinsus olseni]|uniref:Uncharacterized protein n=1 Tax=Perkinsus olseni TaxID=32597 RepID=A0A7J6PF43_PEROL|nr:hypothetical protein FOZ60_007792 [Perkinsus olseni]
MQLMDREKLYILPNFGGSIYLAYGGFVFKEDTPGRAPPGTTYWACSRVQRATRTKPAVYCPARLTVYGDISGDENQLMLLKAPKPHVCGEENAEGHGLRMQMDSLVCSGDLGPRGTAADVYDEETCLEHIRRTMQRNNPRPPVPRCRYGFDIPPKYTRAAFTSESGGAVVEEQILQFDSGRDNTNRHLIFASRSHIEMIARGQDGGQQFGVLVKHKDCFLMSPCAFILMPSRKKSVYDLMFNDLLQLFTGIKISSCIADFKEHAVRSFKDVFNSRQDLVAEVKINLRFSHFSKNVLLRFKRLRMFHSAQKHLRDRRPRCFYNILALAFLPTHLVPAGLLVGCKELDTADYDFMVSYLSQYYTRPNAVFPVEEWNMRDRVLSGLCRSTNSQEAFHRVWGKEVGVNPNIWEWIENTARFIAKERVKVGNLDRGDRPRRKNYFEVTDASLHALLNLPFDEASLESWFQSARTHLRRLTPPGGESPLMMSLKPELIR